MIRSNFIIAKNIPDCSNYLTFSDGFGIMEHYSSQPKQNRVKYLSAISFGKSILDLFH